MSARDRGWARVTLMRLGYLNSGWLFMSFMLVNEELGKDAKDVRHGTSGWDST